MGMERGSEGGGGRGEVSLWQGPQEGGGDRPDARTLAPSTIVKEPMPPSTRFLRISEPVALALSSAILAPSSRC